jgi:hypothetical protein
LVVPVNKNRVDARQIAPAKVLVFEADVLSIFGHVIMYEVGQGTSECQARWSHLGDCRSKNHGDTRSWQTSEFGIFAAHN